ncbi:hypothetical protein BDY21DRAFT_329738 [Lineolata rhizophorae]|uniref:Uncharacterized protein n=1 Tax=Lineolata rhizophorae TaxID=578093 RepID=A0A6A6PD88_9PEZI|nr:hypothetical protein BDY21DRAFT_329738 [Lineolata rhizophorae]
MESLNRLNLTRLTVPEFLNITTEEWLLPGLPANLVFINGTEAEGNVINVESQAGHLPNSSVIIELVQSDKIGTLDTLDFIYLIMAFIILIVLSPAFYTWCKDTTTRREYSALEVDGSLDERGFRRKILRLFPRSQPLTCDEILPQTAGDDVRPEDLQEFRDLLRTKYCMDVDIWALNDVRAVDKEFVLDKMRKSEATVIELRNQVEKWRDMDSVNQWSGEERAALEAIYNRVMSIPLSQYPL